jgi:hypothetical protein
MQFEKVCHDFIERTEENLRIIEAQKGEGSGFEVTQLINSLLGLIVLPKESNLFRETDNLENLQNSGWSLPTRLGGKKIPDNLEQLVKHLRNGIAHWNIVFTANKNNQISKVRFCSKITVGKKKGCIMWEGEFSVNNLRSFVRSLAELGKARATERG